MNKEEEKKKPAVFLDRDGTLIEEVNYLHRVEDLRFFDYTDESVRLLKQAGYLVIIVTNQSGIGRGVYTEADMNNIHEAIQSQLTKKIDAFYFCPHVPDAGCACRKPNLGMVENAMKDFEIDLSQSWFVGDKEIDVLAGKNAGTRTAMVMTGYGKMEVRQLQEPPDIVAKTLLEAVQRIIASEKQYKAIYNLLDDTQQLSILQEAQKAGGGIYPDFGIIGSEDWKYALINGQLEMKALDGVISKIYMSGHNDFPQFEVDDGEEKTQWIREGDEREYLLGSSVRIKYIMVRHSLKGFPVRDGLQKYQGYYPLMLTVEIAR